MNSYKNDATANVAKWLIEEPSLTAIARLFKNAGYQELAKRLGQFVVILPKQYGPSINISTPDGVAWLDESLDIEALNTLLLNL